MAKTTRRSFLQISAALAAGACNPLGLGLGDTDLEQNAAPLEGDGLLAVPGIDLDALSNRTASFPYGVMAGDATNNRVMLWTKFVGSETLGIQIEAASGAAGMAVASRALKSGELGDGGFVHVDISGLDAGVRYRYAFYIISGGKPVARGPFGYVRAAIATTAKEIVTFAGTSCTHQKAAPYALLSDAAGRDVDFFVHCGDHVYTDSGTNAVTLAEYRDKYALAWRASGMRALHGSTGMVTTWDDHEFANDWNPETFPTARLNAARQAFFEHRAVRRSTVDPDRVWRSLVWGQTLEILVLDARSERKPSTRATARAQFISPEQMSWLKDRLDRSTAVFKFVITSVPISNFPAGTADETDKWEGYDAQREEILDFVEKRDLKGVWWLSGDLHFGSVGGIGPTGPRRHMHEVLMGPGGTDPRSPSLPAAQFDRVIDDNNYTLFRADPMKRELTVIFIGPTGKIFERTYSA